MSSRWTADTYLWTQRKPCSMCVPVCMNPSSVFLYVRLCMQLHSLHTSRDITGKWSSAQWMSVGQPWDSVLARGPCVSRLICKKSSVKCGCNSVHISLAWLQTCESPVTFKFCFFFVCKRFKGLSCSLLQSMAISSFRERAESVSAFICGKCPSLHQHFLHFGEHDQSVLKPEIQPSRQL